MYRGYVLKRIIGHSEDDETFPTYVISSPGSDGVKKCAVKETQDSPLANDVVKKNKT